LDRLAGIGARRDATVVALGGGVIGDLAGFAAACWMRGVRVVQAPTTLLAQVDASVGGKTGINHPRGKNLVGAFHQPAAVLADTSTLATLEDREFRAGLAEVVKYGAIRDAAFLDWLRDHAAQLNGKSPLLEEMVARSVKHKAEVVAADELEAGQRMLLNFGHTFGHALETVTGYQRYLHGEAVAIGMAIAARLSVEQLGCPADEADALVALLEALDLPVRLPRAVSNEEMVEAMQMDKKGLASGLRLILLERAGTARVVEDVTDSALRAALDGARA
ncbi:MAG: 3-dehydroquinate synthase, partial [Xanthomonadales bacterium]|nr:3-dehydroquinate synthase [Xanthomonadales bacterium]